MPQHREVDPKNLGIFPEDEAIQEFIDQAGSAPAAEKPAKKKTSASPDDTDENEE